MVGLGTLHLAPEYLQSSTVSLHLYSDFNCLKLLSTIHCLGGEIVWFSKPSLSLHYRLE